MLLQGSEYLIINNNQGGQPALREDKGKERLMRGEQEREEVTVSIIEHVWVNVARSPFHFLLCGSSESCALCTSASKSLLLKVN